MKQLAKKHIKRLTYLLIIFGFLFSNNISYRVKNEAQSNFSKNALSFLLMKEDDPDFIKSLERFNNNHKNLSVVYVNDKNQILYNPDGIKIRNYQRKSFEEENYANDQSFYQALEEKEVYARKSKNILMLIYKNNLWFYLDIYLIVFYTSLLILANILIDRKVSKLINTYTAKLKYDNYPNIIKDNDYIELRPYLDEYVEKIESLESQRDLLKNNLSEFINVTSNMKEGFIIFDENGEVELINDSAKKYLSLDKDIQLSNLIDDKEYDLALRETSILRRSKTIDIKINGYYLKIYIDPLSSKEKKILCYNHSR